MAVDTCVVKAGQVAFRVCWFEPEAVTALSFSGGLLGVFLWFIFGSSHCVCLVTIKKTRSRVFAIFFIFLSSSEPADDRIRSQLLITTFKLW